MTPKQFRTYYWLVNTIKNSAGITLEEINRRWQEKKHISDGQPLNRRTFMRYRNDIESLWGIDISVQPHSRYKYYISNPHVLNDGSIHQWMITTLAVRHLLIENVALHSRVLLEPVPSGEFHLVTIIEAMKENRKIMMSYRKYDDKDSKSWTLSPYCVKMYNRRWYMLGKTEKGTFCTFALDRMESVEVSDEGFELDADFSAADYFKDMYGICRDEKAKKQRIVIRTYGNEHHYLRDLPLHESQREIGSGEGYVDFELCVYPTWELAGYILSRGKRMEVVSPKAYARELMRMKGEL